MKTLLLLLGMVGMGWGQTTGPGTTNPFSGCEGHVSLSKFMDCVVASEHRTKSSPIDVPAIEVKLESRPDSEDGSYLLEFSKACAEWREGKMSWKPEIIACHWNGWTCAEKSRILLTAEDGKKWCHKPQTD